MSDAVRAASAAILADLNSLPIGSHERLMHQLADAVALTISSGNPESLKVFIERLHASVTARQDPHFQKHLAEVKEASPPNPQRMSASDLAAALNG